MVFVKTFRRNAVVFHYDKKDAPGFIFKYSKNETLESLAQRLADAWCIEPENVNNYLKIDDLVL
jgi:hypothetical protein